MKKRMNYEAPSMERIPMTGSLMAVTSSVQVPGSPGGGSYSDALFRSSQHSTITTFELEDFVDDLLTVEP
jgi:hypothetical protein